MKNRKSPRAALGALALCLVAAAAMLVSPAASGQGGRRAAEEIGRALRGFDSLSLDPAEVLRGARELGRVRLATSRGDFDLEVEPFDVRGENYRAVSVGVGGVVTELPRTPSNSWRGRVAGAEGTFVRLVLDGARVQGIIITPAETFFVEPARSLSPSAAPGEYVFYAESDVKQTDGECGVTLGGKVAERVARARVGLDPGATAAAKSDTPEAEAAFAPKAEADVAVEADFEYFNSFAVVGGTQADTTNDMLSIMTAVDGIYDSQLGMKIRVVFSRVWTTNTDPYTETDSEEALFEFAETYDGTFAPGAPPARDLTHMFTGKDFVGSTIGIAFTGVACNVPDFSYGISQSRFSTNFQLRVAVTAHELGHNFGASHPNQESPVPPDCNPSLMNSSAQSTDQFCQFSRDQITNHVAEEGDCMTRLTGGCPYSLTTDPSPFFGAGGGTGSIGVLTENGCVWAASEGADWVNAPLSGTGSGGGAFFVAPNTNSGPRQAAVDVAGQRMIVRQAAATNCFGTRLSPGDTVQGALAPSDCRLGQPGHPQAPADFYTFTARAGQRVRVEMLAAVRASDTPLNQQPPPEALDCFLYLFGPNGAIIAANDDRSGNPHDTDSSMPVSGFITLPATGVYTIAATAFDNNDDGAYTLRLLDNSSAVTVAFSSSSYAVDEGVGGGGLGADGLGFRVVTVTRTGSTAGTATVNYATSDGSASRQKDYTQSLGTLVFAPGETTKTFTVFVSDDTFQEGPETVNLTLSNPVGATLGQSAAVLTVNSNDSANAPSPVRAASFNTGFFIRQHYLDFFTREPDAGGMQFWSNNIEECGADQQCREVKRINVSAAFFLSIEFQETGYLVYRMYKAAYGDATSPGVPGTAPVVRLEEFLPDTQRIGQGVQVNVGDWQTQLENNKQALALEFVLRPRFLNAYPLTMTPAAFVDQLNANAGGVLTQGERDALVAQINGSPDIAAARAAALRQVAEDAQLKTAEFNRAFVLMQYYGYLRRNPDDAPEPTLNFAGWRFWLDKLNSFNGDFIAAEMVKAFITSDEYINRFGQ